MHGKRMQINCSIDDRHSIKGITLSESIEIVAFHSAIMSRDFADRYKNEGYSNYWKTKYNYRDSTGRTKIFID